MFFFFLWPNVKWLWITLLYLREALCVNSAAWIPTDLCFANSTHARSLKMLAGHNIRYAQTSRVCMNIPPVGKKTPVAANLTEEMMSVPNLIESSVHWGERRRKKGVSVRDRLKTENHHFFCFWNVFRSTCGPRFCLVVWAQIGPNLRGDPWPRAPRNDMIPPVRRFKGHPQGAAN